MDCLKIESLGRVFLAMKSDEMESIPDAALNECVDVVGSLLEGICEENKHMCRTVWKKVSFSHRT